MAPDGYGLSYQYSYHPDDSCKDVFGNIVEQELFNIPTNSSQNTNAFKGVQSFASPWLDGATDRVKNFWGPWLDSLESVGITFQYFMGNIADTDTPTPLGYFSNLTRREGNVGEGYTLHHGYVINDPRADSLTAGNAAIYGSLKNQLLLDQGYTLSDFNVMNISDGTTGGYKLLNFVTGRLGGYYLNEGFYKPVQERYPNSQVSNYGNYKFPKEDEIPDSNGHKFYFDVSIGNARSPICYCEMLAAADAYKVNTLDPTKLSYDPEIIPENRYGYDSNGIRSAWKAFLIDHQRIRSLIRSMEPTEKLHPWVKSRGDVFNGAMGGISAIKRAEYWAENIYHISMLNPEALFYFNQAGNDNLIADLLEEINNLKNNKRAISLSQNKNKINFNTHFLATGCKLNTGTRLWRVTTNYDTVDTLIINSVSYTVSTTPGIWFTSGTNSESFEQLSYNGGTKTLTLSKLV
jgi:hypothetical protein